MAVIGLSRIKHLYKSFLDITLEDPIAKKVIEFSEKKLKDLFEIAKERALKEGRMWIEWRDLPLTKGMLLTIERYESKRKELMLPYLDLQPILTTLKPHLGDYTLSKEVEDKLPALMAAILLLIGYVTLELERSKRPTLKEIEQVIKILDITI